jgi:hypothetical protein
MRMTLSPTYRTLLQFSACLSLPLEKEEPSPSFQQAYHGLSPLRYYRKMQGWSQRDVADRITELCNTDAAKTNRYTCLGVDTVSKWERGINKPDSYYSKYLCLLYGVTADKLHLL